MGLPKYVRVEFRPSMMKKGEDALPEIHMEVEVEGRRVKHSCVLDLPFSESLFDWTFARTKMAMKAALMPKRAEERWDTDGIKMGPMVSVKAVREAMERGISAKPTRVVAEVEKVLGEE